METVLIQTVLVETFNVIIVQQLQLIAQPAMPQIICRVETVTLILLQLITVTKLLIKHITVIVPAPVTVSSAPVPAGNTLTLRIL